MKILTVRSSLPDMGPGTQPLTLAKEMSSLGHTTIFATSGGVYTSHIEREGFEVTIIPELAHDRHDIWSVCRAVLELRKLIKRYQPDVVHGHNAAATIVAFLAGLANFSLIPCVTSVRGVEERESHRWRNQIWKLVPGVLLAVCDNTKVRLVSFGVKSERIRVTFNGVSLKKFQPSADLRRKLRQAYSIDDRIVLGVVGAMTGPTNLDGPGKGQHILLRAVKALSERHPELFVVLVGDGPSKHMVEALAEELGINHQVLFLGRRFDIPEMLSLMDIYCLPSIHGEFFPNSIVEAMAMELPWVGSDIAGLSELTAQGKAGMVSEIGNVEALVNNLRRLVSNEQTRKQMGRAARQEVESNFTIDKVTQRIISAYVDAGAEQFSKS